MDEKSTSVLTELQKLRDELKPKPTSVFENALRILEKLVVPVMLGLLAWLASQAATKISESQLKLAESGADDRKLEFRRSMQAKYIEIFYKDLNSGDPKSQSNAIRLVQLVDSDLAKSLLDLVAATPGVSQAVVAQAKEVRREIEAIAPLKGYKIGIYFYRDDAPSLPTVTKLRHRLQEAGFRGLVQDYPNDESFFGRFVPPDTLEVRYEAGAEEDAANALVSILETSSTKSKWKKVQVSSPTPNFVSIFVPRGG